MSTSDDNIRPEEVEKEVVEEKTEESTAKEDNPNAGDETPTQSEGEEPVEKAPEEEPEDKAPEETEPEFAPAEEPAEEAPEKDSGEEHYEDGPYKDTTAKQEKVISEGTPIPQEGEEHEVFCNRYMNHPNVLRKVVPSNRRAAAEAVWKEYKNKV